jgi:DNA-binding PadR family transcriptional regulator
VVSVSLRTIRRLTELEGAVLGLLRRGGEGTAYSVRRVFLTSPSPHWSGSAGAIYPLIARLVRERLLAVRRSARGRRRSSIYTPTPRGLRALRSWLQPPWPPEVTGVPADPLRTRIELVGALTPAERSRFVREAIESVHVHVEAVSRDLARRRESGDRLAELADLGALAALRARVKWLERAAVELARPPKRKRNR